MPPIDQIIQRTMTLIMGNDDKFQLELQEVLGTEDNATAGIAYTQYPRSPQSVHNFSPSVGTYNNLQTSARRGVRPLSTMQMLSDAVYSREVQKMASKQSRRPYSADMAVQMKTTFNPFQTSYKHEFYRKDEPEGMSVRPASHIQLSNSALREETTYKKEFTGQRTTPNYRLWSGGNNPHPSQAFMVWKYPTRKANSGTEEHAGDAPTLTNADFDKAMRGKSKSTYQVDYKGLPPGYMPAEYGDVPKDWKSSIPYTLDTDQRISYQTPNQPKPLTNNTKRFDHSGHDRHKLLVGIAPNASQRRQTVRTNTTYHRHYNETAPLVEQSAAVHFPTHARTVVKGKGAEELSAMYESIKRNYFPKHARNVSAASLRIGGCTRDAPLTPYSGVPHVSPGTGVLYIPRPSFTTTPVPEPICEPV